MQTAGAFYLLSAVFELTQIMVKIPLLGSIRSGVVAAIYHLLYVAVFTAMGLGLLIAKPWGYRAVLGGTAFYSIERAIFLFDQQGREADLGQLLDRFGGRTLVDVRYILAISTLTTVLFLACWWGFGIYVYFKRDYFRTTTPA